MKRKIIFLTFFLNTSKHFYEYETSTDVYVKTVITNEIDIYVVSYQLCMNRDIDVRFIVKKDDISIHTYLNVLLQKLIPFIMEENELFSNTLTIDIHYKWALLKIQNSQNTTLQITDISNILIEKNDEFMDFISLCSSFGGIEMNVFKKKIKIIRENQDWQLDIVDTHTLPNSYIMKHLKVMEFIVNMFFPFMVYINVDISDLGKFRIKCGPTFSLITYAFTTLPSDTISQINNEEFKALFFYLLKNIPSLNINFGYLGVTFYTKLNALFQCRYENFNVKKLTLDRIINEVLLSQRNIFNYSLIIKKFISRWIQSKNKKQIEMKKKKKKKKKNKNKNKKKRVTFDLTQNQVSSISPALDIEDIECDMSNLSLTQKEEEEKQIGY